MRVGSFSAKDMVDKTMSIAREMCDPEELRCLNGSGGSEIMEVLVMVIIGVTIVEIVLRIIYLLLVVKLDIKGKILIGILGVVIYLIASGQIETITSSMHSVVTIGDPRVILAIFLTLAVVSGRLISKDL